MAKTAPRDAVSLKNRTYCLVSRDNARKKPAASVFELDPERASKKNGSREILQWRSLGHRVPCEKLATQVRSVEAIYVRQIVLAFPCVRALGTMRTECRMAKRVESDASWQAKDVKNVGFLVFHSPNCRSGTSEA